jgi:hypothetical protein
MYYTSIEPCYQIINRNAPQEQQQDTSMWATPRYLNTPGRSTKSCHGPTALQGSSNPLYNGVVNPMFKKSSTHGVVGDVIKHPFFVSANAESCLLVKHLLYLNHELMKGHFHRFSSLVCMLIGM